MTTPLCRCGVPAAWLRGWWWCAARRGARGCGLEVRADVPPAEPVLCAVGEHESQLFGARGSEWVRDDAMKVVCAQKMLARLEQVQKARGAQA